MLPEGLMILGIVGIVLFSIVGCLTVSCLCCAVPLCLLCSKMFYSRGTKVTKSASQYQMVDVIERNSRHEFVSPLQKTEVYAEPMAEAYLVPPLVTVHTENSDIVFGVVETVDATTPIQEKNSVKSGGFRDIWAAVLFLVNVLFVLWFAVQAYFVAVASKEYDTVSGTITDKEAAANTSLLVMNVILISSAVLAVVASLLGSVWLSFLMAHAERLIEFVMWMNIALLVVSTVGSLLAGQIIPCIIFAVLAGLSYWYYLAVRNRIPFASAVIRTACAAIKANYTGLVSTAYGMMFLQMLWFMLWSAAYYGLFQQIKAAHATTTPTDASHSHHTTTQDNDTTTTSNNDTNNQVLGWVTFGMLVSLYWGAQVIKGVMQTTVCGSVACWWFQPARAAPVRGSLFRATTTSFGSICFGALIVAVVQALREMLNIVKNQAQKRRGRDRNLALECLVGLTEWLLGCLEAALNYFNMYAYCYVAAYGLDFVTSGKQVTSLFKRRGWSAIINDSLISRTITLGVMALALFAGLLGALLSQTLVGTPYAAGQTAQPLAIAGGLLGALMGLAVGMILTNAIESAVAMVFVSFAEDPSSLQSHHREEFDNLLAKWRVAYPETVEWVCCGESNGHNGGSTSSGLFGAHKHNQQHKNQHQQHGIPPMAQAVPITNSNAGVNYLPYTAAAGAAPGGYVYQPAAYHKQGGNGNPPPMNPNYTGV